MFKLQYPKTQVIYGNDALEWLSNVESKKVAIVTTRSLLNSKLLSKISSLIKGDVMEGPRQHTPEDDVNKLAKVLSNYDTVIGLGGGSIIDGIKIIFQGYYIAIPTTLAGAEHTQFGGFTSEGLKRSKPGKDIDLVILDPRATLETPKWLLIASGVRAIDHAIEALYSEDSNPFTDSLAIEGFKKLITCLRDVDSLENRGLCQIGTWLSSLTMRYVRMGLSHVFGYVYGPRYNIPHGITSCISLPYAIKLNYNIAKNKLREIETNDTPLYEFMERFLIELGIRKKLGEYTKLEDALKYVDVFVNLVNNSGNPIKIDTETAKKFIKEVY
ncbi:iron-containing alcohol dehydrogenase [Sulfolobus sp. S-194]|uniref:iron-containing alcohol dehydrogenase n=1 Tax=Sulfolobus sp. S-194 TaxID=2512240 RepID=UPI00143714C3|nr:iron-containing alcohol dehydrogenase [Sulfolobus sp. S-194]QIW24622.1 iron-containing alcohol dehydrogenase [Sulfolobus sp. S-194]